MRLTTRILVLYLSSAEGAQLADGFAQLIREDGDEEPEDEAPPSSDALAEGSVDDAEEDGDDEELTPEEEAQLAVGDSCFSEVTHAVERTLAELGWAAPSSPAEARALYERLFEHGLSVGDKDILAFLGDDGALEDDDDDSDDEEDVLELGAATEDASKLWAANIGAISWALHVFAPEWFVPYGFTHSFHQFEAICEEFGIPLPRLPGKAGYAERARYYLDLNEALQEFRNAYEMTPAGFDAFLYGFCKEQVPLDEAPELPPAERAWFLMADPEADFDNLDASTDETRSFWQGHLDMRPGDIGVMWCRSPRSSVHSIWRATSRGFADPFFFHYRMVWIGHSIHVPAITFRELASDPTWAEKPALKAHFQGSSGKEVTAAEYAALLRLFEAEGIDVAQLPALERHDHELPDDIENEREVEDRLLEPLLHRLGFTAKDWVRQFPLRMGRGQRVYPDYVLGADGKRGEEGAKLLAEAKYRIGSNADLREAYLQACWVQFPPSAS